MTARERRRGRVRVHAHGRGYPPGVRETRRLNDFAGRDRILGSRRKL